MELFSGAAGFACAAGDLFTRRTTMPAESLDAIGQVRRESLAHVVEHLSGPLSTRQGVSTGFAHGLSAELFVCLDCASAADVVEARLREFAELAVHQPPLTMWRARVGEPGFSPLPGSWCNGLAGNLLLFCRAAEILRSDYYRALAAQIAHTTFAVRSADASLCCGSSGQALALARYARLSGDRRFRRRARARLDQALAQSRRLPLEKLWQGQAGVALTALRFMAGGGRFPVVESPPPKRRMYI